REQPRRMYLQWRRAPAARFGCATPSLVKALHPFDCRTWADVELLGCLTSRSPAFDACDHPHANVRRICLRRGSAPSESMRPDSPIYRSLGILRFYSARTCSRCLGPTQRRDPFHHLSEDSHTICPLGARPINLSTSARGCRSNRLAKRTRPKIGPWSQIRGLLLTIERNLFST